MLQSEAVSMDAVKTALREMDLERRNALFREFGTRERLPDDRDGKTHHFVITYAKKPIEGAEGTTELEEIDGYITANRYPDGRLGEVFVRIAKMGEDLSCLLDGFATTFSIALQSGADLAQLCSKLIGTRAEIHGPTSDADIRYCTSILDYIGRWIALRHLPHGSAVWVMAASAREGHDGGTEVLALPPAQGVV